MTSALPVARTALLALVLALAVVATGVVLYLSWPAGVALGLGVGVVACLGLGARMQVVDRAVPTDRDLERRLGIGAAEEVVAAPEAPVAAPERVAAAPERVVVTASAARPEPAPLPGLQPLPDLLYFEEGEPRLAADLVGETGAVRADLERLKADLGDDYSDFARAARLVVSTQHASAARLQRDLQLTYSRARRLLVDLEAQHFVGPATGSLPRQVLLPKEALPEVERLLAV